MPDPISYAQALEKSLLVFDGAMGTLVQDAGLSDSEYGGHPGCPEILAETRPDLIKAIHLNYLEAGADVIETDTFGANGITLKDFGLEGKTRALNRTAALLAVQSAKAFAGKRSIGPFVAGSIGPGSKLPSLGHVRRDDVSAAYLPQILGLMDGGVDLLLIETVQDILHAKAVYSACLDAFTQLNRKVPVQIQITVDPKGRMLLGQSVETAVTSLSALDLVALGVNCSVGTTSMDRVLADFHQYSPLPITCQPNAGLPRKTAGSVVYDQSPDDFGRDLAALAKTYGLAVVGGCCGTRPESIKCLREHLSGKIVRRPAPLRRAVVCGSYETVPLKDPSRVVILGERCSASGSRAFRDLIKADNLDGMVSIAKQQKQNGARILDVSVAIVGRDERIDLPNVVGWLVSQTGSPISADSTIPDAVEAALKTVPGKAIINSVNLEQGDTKAGQIFGMARRFGAAVIGLLIDEEGMAKTVERKLAVARRLFDLATRHYGLPATDLLLDPLTFTLATGDDEASLLARASLETISALHEAFPQCPVIMGVSNVSHGFPPAARRVLNALFLDRCREAGCDAAIFNPADLPFVGTIGGEDKGVFDALIDGKMLPDGRHPISWILEHYRQAAQDLRQQSKTGGKSGLRNPEDRLRNLVIGGEKHGLEDVVHTLLRDRTALDVVNFILLPAMAEVGDEFARGRLFLPMMLQSAETMQAAVAILEPELVKSGASAGQKGKVVLATVAGDVHDIGKNLVRILTQSHGYQVIDLGIRQSIDSILAAIDSFHPDTLGLSGLLVQSAQVMLENLLVMKRNGLTLPVVLGGAALTREFVVKECRPVYGENVHYGATALDLLSVLKGPKTG